MTISSETARSGPYTGNGITDTFAYGFKVYDQADLKVVHTTVLDVESTWTVDVDYTVTDVGEDAGGNCVAATPPATGETITILRDMDLLQGTALTNQSGYVGEAHERAWDELTQMTQQVSEKTDRALMLPESSGSTGLSLPEPDAGKPIKWNTAEDGFDNGSTDLDSIISDATTQASAASTSATAASTSATAAAASETAAAASATTATTQASNASTSATNAANSATAAAASETAAETAETNAETAETNAAASASTASTQASNASTSATAASNSATAAANSATAAAASATTAEEAATSLAIALG